MPRPHGHVSQQQLAQELGISQALVSLVLNGHKEGINQKTYARVWQHALKRGYQPKGMSMTGSAQQCQVGVILRAPLQLSTPSVYFGHVHQGLHAELEKQGFTTVFIGSEDGLETEKLQRFFQSGHLLHGVVLLGEVAQPFLAKLHSFESRIVAVSARHPGICHSVVGNEPQALDMLVRHLHELGHRRIGWLGGNAGLGRHEARFSAFQAALVQAGLPFDERYVVKLQQADRSEGTEAVHMMLPHARRSDFPTAFICYNCLMAAGAVRALVHEGWQVPHDISVAGADAPPHLPFKDAPKITGAGSDPVKLGEAAARLVLASTGAADESFTDLILPAQFVAGETTGPPGDGGRNSSADGFVQSDSAARRRRQLVTAKTARPPAKTA
jgi:LacI family transcriptional regulator